MPVRPQRYRRGETAVAAYVSSCTSRDGAKKSLWFGFDAHRLGDDLDLLQELAVEFAADLPPHAWLYRRLAELKGVSR